MGEQTKSPARRREIASTGIPGLDDILGGGLERARLYLVLGHPGVGKTTLAMQFLLEGVRHHEPCLYVSLSETRDEIETVASSHGWSLDGVAVLELPIGADAHDVQTLFQPAEVELEEALRPLLNALDQLKPRRVVVDSLSELRLLAQDQRRFRRQLHGLKTHFVRRGCTALLLDDRAAGSADSAPQTLAHGVLQLEAVAPAYGVVRRRLLVRKLRAAAYREGYHDYTIETGGVVAYPRLVAAEHRPAGDPGAFPSGVAALDRLVGRVRRGSSILIAGASGTGKSTLSTQYVVAAAERGEHAAVFLFEERWEAYTARAAETGMDLAPHLAADRVRVQRVDPAELSPGHFIFLVRAAVERWQARLVVIDSLNGYLSSAPGEPLMIVHLRELITYLGQMGTTTVSTFVQHGIYGPVMRDDIDISYLADVVVALRFFEAMGAIRKVISVPKNRSSVHGMQLSEFRIDGRGVHIGEPLLRFQGVLTGTPRYLGPLAALDPAEGHGPSQP